MTAVASVAPPNDKTMPKSVKEDAITVKIIKTRVDIRFRFRSVLFSFGKCTKSKIPSRTPTKTIGYVNKMATMIPKRHAVARVSVVA